MDKNKLKAMAATYLRAGIASVIALYLAGVTDPKALASAALGFFFYAILSTGQGIVTRFPQLTQVASRKYQTSS